MLYLVMAPTDREYANITAAIARGGHKNRYEVCKCGVGKALAAANTAAALLRGGLRYDRIAVIGYAAATAGQQRGRLVAPCAARYHDCRVPAAFVPELAETYRLLGRDKVEVWTGDAFVDAAIAAEVKQRLGMDAGLFDMETAAICQAAATLTDIPVVVVKMVSDIPEECDTEHSYDAFVDSHSDFGTILDYIENLE